MTQPNAWTWGGLEVHYTKDNLPGVLLNALAVKIQINASTLRGRWRRSFAATDDSLPTESKTPYRTVVTESIAATIATEYNTDNPKIAASLRSLARDLSGLSVIAKAGVQVPPIQAPPIQAPPAVPPLPGEPKVDPFEPGPTPSFDPLPPIDRLGRLPRLSPGLPPVLRTTLKDTLRELLAEMLPEALHRAVHGLSVNLGDDDLGTLRRIVREELAAAHGLADYPAWVIEAEPRYIAGELGTYAAIASAYAVPLVDVEEVGRARSWHRRQTEHARAKLAEAHARARKAAAETPAPKPAPGVTIGRS